MEETFLYRQIADTLRKKILLGKMEAGSRLPSVRAMADTWNCTIGTIQHAYKELARQGLVTSRPGQGTRVMDRLPVQDEALFRRAALINRAEAFLLDIFTEGYAPGEVEEAVRLALDHWRIIGQQSSAPADQEVRFNGSHDAAVAWLAAHFSDIAPGYTFQPGFSGSLGGLIALAEGRAELAGCHLWDVDSETYNIPYVQRLLPGLRVALVTLAYRRLGLMVPPENPFKVSGLRDLVNAQIRFVNRQQGSGTRVWLDTMLRRLDIPSRAIQGYSIEKMTHYDVARAIVEGQANVGLGLEFAARAYGLDFICLTKEKYDLIIPEKNMDLTPIKALVEWLKHPEGKNAIGNLTGYEAIETGKLEWVK
jgi:molybdate-binding protein/DNA-binding transcriptional regulator YhcF (GntR family)